MLITHMTRMCRTPISHIYELHQTYIDYLSIIYRNYIDQLRSYYPRRPVTTRYDPHGSPGSHGSVSFVTVRTVHTVRFHVQGSGHIVSHGSVSSSWLTGHIGSHGSVSSSRLRPHRFARFGFKFRADARSVRTVLFQVKG